MQDIPGSSQAVLDYIENDLYLPPVSTFNTTSQELGYTYNSTTERLASVISDFAVDCNVVALADAMGVNQTYTYLFAENAGLHGEDVAFTFYDDGPTPDPEYVGLINTTIAITLQDWIIGFVAARNPNVQGISPVPVYGDNQNMAVLSHELLGQSVTDTANTTRCAFWNKALYC